MNNELIDAIATAIDDKKGQDIVCLDLTEFDGAICDAFIICNADSTTQVCAIADGVEDDVLKELKQKASRVEGKENGLWVIMDYGEVMIHIFQSPMRKFYALEDLWADAHLTRFEFE
ncbi:MAG: ribosome silencing factor [Rikenellaceae bacterium]|jgi:ribosome-associated protein|nr:ribosome silencing factor [Rikenellaceae bacterium]